MATTERYLLVAEVVGLLRMTGENPKHPIGWLPPSSLVSLPASAHGEVVATTERYLLVAEVVGLLRMTGENPKHPIGWLFRSVLVLCDSLPASRIWGWYTFLKMHLLYALYC